MRSARVARTLTGTVHEAQTLWYDTARWPSFVDGLERVLAVAGDWPNAGATVTWQSGPAGRGHVSERVLAHEPLAGQTVEVQDDSIRGRQTISFTPVDGSVEVELSLEYEIKQRSLFTAVIDALFIRRAMAASLGRTLERFEGELAAARRAAVG